MINRPLFTICIPAYNRAVFLGPLLDSIFQQDWVNYEVLVCEDCSPERHEIAIIVSRYQTKYPERLRYHENDRNLGYDGNIRELIQRADGEYCLFLGNDDLMCEGALSAVGDITNRFNDCGVVVRSYATFDSNPLNLKQVFRYFPNEHFIFKGREAIIAAVRRSVVIPGLVIHCDTAKRFATNAFDGTLLYQIYLVGMVLTARSVVFTPKIIALRRDGVKPDFGNSDAEKGKFTPKEQTPESSLHFMAGMIQISKDLQKLSGIDVASEIQNDIFNYSYPVLSIQARGKKTVFVKYWFSLACMGFWRSKLFHSYFIALMFFGPEPVDRMILWVKNRIGYTPLLGKIRKYSK